MARLRPNAPKLALPGHVREFIPVSPGSPELQLATKGRWEVQKQLARVRSRACWLAAGWRRIARAGPGSDLRRPWRGGERAAFPWAHAAHREA